MTKDQNKVRRTQHCSRIWASAPRHYKEYYNSLINTTLYNLKLRSKESHNSRHKVKIIIAHSETNGKVQQEAIKDLKLNSQSLNVRPVSTCTCTDNYCQRRDFWTIRVFVPPLLLLRLCRTSSRVRFLRRFRFSGLRRAFPVVDASVCCLCFSVGGFPSSLLSLSSDFDLDWCGWKFSPVSHLCLFVGTGCDGWQGW